MKTFEGRTWFALACLGVALTFSSVGSAQSDQERAGARSAAKEGIQAFQDGNFEDSLKLLNRAESLVHAPTHLLFIARSQVKLGQLVEAREAYKKIITENLKDNAPKAFLAAQEAAPVELEEIEGRIAKLKVEVQGPEGVELSNLTVTIGGSPLSSQLIGLSVPANPGKVEVVATADGMLSQTQTVELEAGGRGAVQLVLEVDPNAPVEAVVQPSEETQGEAPEPEEAGPNRKRTWGWVSMGVGGAALVTGATLGIISLTQVNKAKNDEDLCGQDFECTDAGWEVVDPAQTKALVADISLGVGIVAVGVGTYLLLTSKKKSNDVGIRNIVPSADRNGGYLTIQGGF